MIVTPNIIQLFITQTPKSEEPISVRLFGSIKITKMKPKWFKNTIAFLIYFFGLSVSSYSMDDAEVFAFTDFISGLVKTSVIQKSGSFCVLGSDEISSVLMMKDRKILDITKNLDKFNSCKAIYIARGSEKSLKLEIAKFNNAKIMTIAVFDGFTEIGGMFQVQIGRRNFEIISNQKVLKDSNVKISSLLSGLIIN